MKNLSILITVLLLIPIAYSVFSFYSMPGADIFGGIDHLFMWRMLSPIFMDLLYIGVAVFWNVKEKFLINVVMCTTLLVAFFISIGLNFGITLIYQWSK